MRKRDELADPASCLNKARDDEDIFVLLARDKSAAFAVYSWANHRVITGKNRHDDAQIQSALEWARRVENG